jgi:hypothetical protein
LKQKPPKTLGEIYNAAVKLKEDGIKNRVKVKNAVDRVNER